MERTVIHIVGGGSRSRAEQARIAFALGHHAEIYADNRELIASLPEEGIVLAADPGTPAGVREMIDNLGESGVLLPLVCVSENVRIEQVVAAVRAGALDYLELPLEMSRFVRRLELVAEEAGNYSARRRSEVEARHRISHLSRREREVLRGLGNGLTNKQIAQELAISPRTVEIHRANMMSKLSAGNSADAVRAWIVAGLDRLQPEQAPKDFPPDLPFAAEAGSAEAAARRRQRQ